MDYKMKVSLSPQEIKELSSINRTHHFQWKVGLIYIKLNFGFPIQVLSNIK